MGNVQGIYSESDRERPYSNFVPSSSLLTSMRRRYSWNRKFGTQEVVKCQISNVKNKEGLRSWRFEPWCFVRANSWNYTFQKCDRDRIRITSLHFQAKLAHCLTKLYGKLPFTLQPRGQSERVWRYSGSKWMQLYDSVKNANWEETRQESNATA